MRPWKTRKDHTNGKECEFLAVECESIFRPPFADVSELAALPPLLWGHPYLQPASVSVTCSAAGAREAENVWAQASWVYGLKWCPNAVHIPADSGLDVHLFEIQLSICALDAFLKTSRRLETRKPRARWLGATPI
jgi:hypothetical protein